MVKCQKGHYYDDNRYDRCPYCENVMKQYAKERNEVTVAKRDVGISAAEVGRLVGRKAGLPEADEGRTISLYSPLKGNDYVTGWLVCVEGAEYGRDFRLHHGFNRIGRSPAMDVALLSDKQISRDIHCQIVYENRENRFFLVPSGGNLVYLNREPVYDAAAISTGDIIGVGGTLFQFIAFCEGDRKWEKEEK